MKASEVDKTFSLKRVALVLKSRVLEDLPTAFITAGIVFGANLVVLILTGKIPLNEVKFDGSAIPFWGVGIALLGLYLASRSFKGMHGRDGTEWILLPATGAEKYASSLAWILVVWPIVSALAAMASSAALAGIALLGGARPGVIWHPFSRFGLEAFLKYVTFAPVLIAGSAVFRKNALIKTLGIIAACSVAATLIVVPLFMWRYGERRYGGSFSFDNGAFSFSGNENLKGLQSLIQGLADTWRFAILPGFALVFAYFRVAEKEAIDEVQ